jgi:hypothetical protein
VIAGSVLGEMAMFRGGKRGCDMRASNAGQIAVLRFALLSSITSVRLVQKLMMAFGREAYLHSVHPQATPSSAYAEASSGTFAAAQTVLLRHGWTQRELAPLFEQLTVSAIEAGGSILMKGRTIDFIVLVLQGAPPRKPTAARDGRPPRPPRSTPPARLL